MHAGAVSSLLLAGACVAGVVRPARADDAAPATAPAASMSASAPAGPEADTRASRFLRFEGPRFLSFGMSLYRGDARVEAGFFLEKLPGLVLGSKVGELHAKRARTARVVSFSCAVAAVLAGGGGVIASHTIDDPGTRADLGLATVAVTLGLLVAGIYGMAAMDAELMRAINAYNYDVVRGTLAP